MRILIVDDSKAMQTIVWKTLVSAGYADHEFQFAFNGTEALMTIRDWRPDLVLSDWHMPEMTGLELLKKVRGEKLNVKFGLVTTERSESSIRAAKDAGALFIVSKPFNANTLHEAIEDALSDSVETDIGSTPIDIALPSTKKIAKAINSFGRHKTYVVDAEEKSLNYDNTPFMVALYEDDESKSTVAAMILDIEACCNIGSAMGGMSPSEANIAVVNQLIPQAIFDNCKSLANLMSTLIHDRAHDIDVTVKAVHLINNPNGKLKTLIENKIQTGMSLETDSEDYGKGRMVLLKL